MTHIFFRCVDPDTYYYYHFANQPTRNNFRDCPYKKISCLCLKQERKHNLKVNFVLLLLHVCTKAAQSIFPQSIHSQY